MTARACIASLVVLLLAGCGARDMSDLRQYVAEVKARQPGPIEQLPEVQQVDIFVYDDANRRDPFALDDTSAAAIARGPGGGGIEPDRLRVKEELERFSLDSLRMVGTLAQDDTNWGLVATSEGTLHRVRVGNYMGLNNGQITHITDEAIELIEIVSDNAGGWQERQATIGLSQ